jgi:alpha-glucuronidase
MIGVSGVGRDGWLGSPLAMANLYAFGRLAWNPNLTPEQIAEEWTHANHKHRPAGGLHRDKMLMQSWPAYEHYTGTAGHADAHRHHRQPLRPQHRIQRAQRLGPMAPRRREGIGMDRTVATGTGFAGQYPPEVAKMYESPATTPDNLLLFFHHVPYSYKPALGQNRHSAHLRQPLRGARRRRGSFATGPTLKGRIDPPLYKTSSPAHIPGRPRHRLARRHRAVLLKAQRHSRPEGPRRPLSRPARSRRRAPHRLQGHRCHAVGRCIGRQSGL